MGLFFNRKDKQHQEQRRAELKQRREQLVAQFERGIASLKPVFAEAVEHGYGKAVIGKNRTIERMLWLDLTSIVLNIANEAGDRSFNDGGQTAAAYAFSILRRVAPEELPELGTYQPKFANKHFDPAAQQWAEGLEYRLACEELLRDCGCEFISPGMLSVMQEYDGIHRTLHAPAIADMFIAFLGALEATPSLKGARILSAYVSALKERQMAQLVGSEK